MPAVGPSDDGNNTPNDGCDAVCQVDMDLGDCLDPNPDSDGDGTVDCLETCPADPAKTAPGLCGCGHSDRADSDNDGAIDCLDSCSTDPARRAPGLCGCGSDTDGDGLTDLLETGTTLTDPTNPDTDDDRKTDAISRRRRHRGPPIRPPPWPRNKEAAVKHVSRRRVRDAAPSPGPPTISYKDELASRS